MAEETTDDLIRRMEKDERDSVYDLLDDQDQDGMGVHELELMSPRDYAQSRDLIPQQVYYYIRQGVIKSVGCLCGRTVVEAHQADRALAKRRKEQRGGTNLEESEG